MQLWQQPSEASNGSVTAATTLIEHLEQNHPYTLFKRDLFRTVTTNAVGLPVSECIYPPRRDSSILYLASAPDNSITWITEIFRTYRRLPLDNLTDEDVSPIRRVRAIDHSVQGDAQKPHLQCYAVSNGRAASKPDFTRTITSEGNFLEDGPLAKARHDISHPKTSCESNMPAYVSAVALAANHVPRRRCMRKL